MKKSVPVISNEGKFYDSIKAAAEFNSTAVVSVWNVIHGRQKTAKGKSFRRATPEEVELARKLDSSSRKWDHKLPQSSEQPAAVKAEPQPAPAAVSKATPQTLTGQILDTPPLVGPGVSIADAQLLRLQFGRFDVLWRQYCSHIFNLNDIIREEDVQLGNLLEVALANLQRSYDRERSKRQGG